MGSLIFSVKRITKHIKGITKRWIINSLRLMFIILFLVILISFLIIKNHFYSKSKKNLIEISENMINTLHNQGIESESDFFIKSAAYLKDFNESEWAEIKVISSDNRVLLVSEGFKSNYNNITNYVNNDNSQLKYEYFVGNNETNEKIMAITQFIYSDSNNYLGNIKFITSLQYTNQKIMTIILMLCLFGLLFIFVSAISSIYFIKSIVTPINEMGLVANKIARGDFKARMNKKYNDEIGELCDIINYMACELGKSEQMKNDFISSISHELRTPLTAIKGWAETMQVGKTVDLNTFDKGLNIIINESERLSSIVEELLDLSHMQSGRMILTLEKIDILAELDESVYILKDNAEAEKITLVYDSPKTVSPILGDKNRLKQVFINIIDNAIKYSNSGEKIFIQLEEKNNFIKIIVTDNGCGISKKDIPKVKEKFYKANNSKRGSGIGLAIADEIIQLHSGSLEIISEEGIGTIVNIFIPIMKSNMS